MRKYTISILLSVLCVFTVSSVWAVEKPTLDTAEGCIVIGCPAGYVCDDHSRCVPEETEEGESMPCTSLPVLANFTITDSSYATDEVYLKLTPKTENPPFHLHILLRNNNEKDELVTWCTGDERFCKVIGNGQNCSNPRSEANAWCYEATATPQ